MINRVLILISIVLHFSCSLNKQFLYPEKIPAQARYGVAIHTSGKAIPVEVNGEHHQPTFLDSAGTPLSLPFQIKSIMLPCKSGRTLNIWFMSPTEKKHHQVTFFVLHGNGGNLYSQYAIYLPLVEAGYQVAMVDYSGFGFSTGKATRKNTEEDAIDFLNFMINYPDARETTKILYGQSYGGHLAMCVASDFQQSLDGVISDASFSSPDDIAAHISGLGFLARLATATYFDASERVPALKLPILFIHSKNDETIPYSMAQELHTCATPPKALYSTTGCHICGPEEAIEEIKDFVSQLETSE